MRITTIAVLPIVLALASCNSNRISGSPAGLPHAVAVSSCGPADGPAVSIYLTREPYSDNPRPPYVVLHMNRSVTQLAGQSFQIGTAESQATATRFLSSTELLSATSGRIVIESVSANNVVSGSVSLSFPTGPVVGRFTAGWMERLMLCG